ncbi:hypothetical protein FSST1_010318 [Fusarium sambucinum]
MSEAGTPSWRSRLGCHGLCCVAAGSSTAAVTESEDIPLRNVAIPQGRASAGLPPDQISRRTEPTENTAPVSIPQPNDETSIQPAIESQDSAINSKPSDSYDALREQQKELQKLWKEAMDKFEASQDGVNLSEVLKTQKKIDTANSEVELVKIIKALEGEMKRVGIRGKIADTIGKVVPHLNRFAIVGDIAVSANPNPAALPWAAVRFVLLNITAGEEIRGKIVEGIAEILILMFECCVYHELHLTTAVPKRLSAVKRLRDAIVDALSQCIRFLAFAIRRQEAGAKALTDVFRLEDFSGYLKDLYKVKVQLHDAGLSCEMYQNSQSRELLKDLHKLIITMREGSIQRLEQEARSKLKNLLLDPKDAFDHIQHPEDSLCLPGTRQKVLREIYDWTEDAGSPTICWLPGLAGTGKSTISRTVARDLKGQSLGGCFFFKKSAGSRAGGRSIFPIIAYQLALNIPPVRQHIIDAAQEDLSPLTGSMHEQWRRLIQEPLDKVQDKEFLRQVVLVVDALDECAKVDQETVMALLTKCSDVLKVFVTSRPEFKIEAYFARQQFHREIVLHRVELDDIQSDIKLFLRYHIRILLLEHNACFTDKALCLKDDWPGNDRFQTLVNRSIPLFIAAATFVRMIVDTDWAGSLDSKLDFIIEKSSNVSSAYEMIYNPVLYLISNGPPHEARLETHDRFTYIIGSVILLASPLSIASLAVLLGVETHDVIAQINPLRSVLEISRDGSPIKLFHLSFRDFLLSDSAEKLKVDEALTHSKLASRCIKHLQKELRIDICGLESPGKCRSDIDPAIINHHVTKETEYASLYWVHHLIGSGKQVRDDDEEHQFLKEFFLNWIEVLCLIGKVIESMNILQALLDIINGDEMLRFVQDAIRFVRFFRAAIDEYPLQLYHSGTIFSPRSSIVPQPLKDRPCPTSVMRLPTVDSDWPQSLQAFEIGENSIGIQLAFLSNNRVISWGLYRDAKIWNVSSGICLQTLEDDKGFRGGSQPVAIGLFCEGHLLAMGTDERIEIWDFNSHSMINRLALKGRLVLNVAFSDDGTRLCSISKASAEVHNEPLLHIHNIGTGDCTFEVQIRNDYSVICFSMKGHWLACVADKSIWLSSWGSLKAPKWVKLGAEKYTNPYVEFSLDGSLLALSSWYGYVRIWRTGSKQLLRTLQCPYAGSISGLSLTQDWLVVSISSHAVVFNLKSGRVSHEINKIAEGNLAISSDSKFLSTVSEVGTVRVWNLFPKQSSNIEDFHPNPVEFLTITSDNRRVISACKDQVKSWNVSRGQCLYTSSDSNLMFRIATQDGSFFATGLERRVEIWNTNPMRLVKSFRREDGPFSVAIDPWAISGDGQLLAISSLHHEHRIERIELWDVNTALLLQTFEFSLLSHLDIAFAPDGSQIAITTKDTIEIWQISRPCKLHTRIKDIGRYFFPSLWFDNKRLVGMCPSGDIKAWDINTGKLSSWCRTDKYRLARSFVDYDVLFDHVGPDGHLRHDVLRELQLSDDSNWIVRSEEKVLWLPPEYRPSKEYALGSTYTSGSMIAIGTKLGRVFNLYMA